MYNLLFFSIYQNTHTCIAFFASMHFGIKLCLCGYGEHGRAVDKIIILQHVGTKSGRNGRLPKKEQDRTKNT